MSPDLAIHLQLGLAGLGLLTVFVWWLLGGGVRTGQAGPEWHAQLQVHLAPWGAIRAHTEQHGKREVEVYTVEFPEGGPTGRARWFPGSPLELRYDLEPGAIEDPYAQVEETLPLLRLRPETRADRLGKALRIDREIETGDADFDRQVYVESDLPDERHARLLADPLVRQAVRELLDAGVSAIHLGRPGNPLGVEVPAAERAPDPDTLDRMRLALGRLAAALPTFQTIPEGNAPYGQGLVVFSLINVTLGLMFVGLLDALYPVLDGNALYRVAAPTSLVVCVLGFGLVVWRLRGRARSLRQLSVMAMLCPPLAIELAFGAILLLNGCLDGDRTARRAHVERTWTSSGSKSTTYYAELSGWGGEPDPVELRVRWSDHSRLRTGKSVRLVVGHGRLGLPWFADLEHDE